MRVPLPLRGIVLIASLIALGLVLRHAGLERFFERPWIDAHVRGHGIQGYGTFLVAGSVVTALGLPRQLVAFFGGYAFGALEGMLWASLASVGGCILAFYYARLFGRRLVRRLFAAKLKRFDALVRGHDFAVTLLVRLLPVGSNLLTNLLAGVSGISGIRFFAASALGYLPQTIAFALAGSGLTPGSGWQLALSVILFLVSGWLGFRLYRHWHRSAALSGHPDGTGRVAREER